jgi:hypothetical protein
MCGVRLQNVHSMAKLTNPVVSAQPDATQNYLHKVCLDHMTLMS